MVDLARIDDLVLSVYLCQGTMPRHRHLDQDELFWVHSGTISLESEWGTALLREGDLTVAPKGVEHRSSSLVRSLVLLFQPRPMVNRRNGHRRLYALRGGGRLEKVNVSALGQQIVVPFQNVKLSDVDTFALNVMLCQGTSARWQSEDQATLILCYAGSVDVDTDLGHVSLLAGELVVFPRGVGYRIASVTPSLVVGLQRHEHPSLPPES